MADDINVVFGADTTQLDAAVGKVKSEMQSLVPGAPGSGILTPLPQAFGGAPSTLLERATAAAKANAAAAAQAGTAMKNYGLELEETGGKAERAGINIGAMMERIAVRLVIFEALRLVIQGIKYAFDQISNLQQARIQFDAMSDSVDHLAGRFEYLKQQAAGGFLPIEKAVQVRNTLQDYGASADQAAIYVKDLGQWSQILGVDADKLAQSLGRVAEGEGSLQDMRLVTHMMGEQSAAGRQLIQTIVDATKALENFKTEQAAAEKGMDAVIRATERMGEKIQRQRDVHESFLEKVLTKGPAAPSPYAGFDPALLRAVGLGQKIDTSQMDPMLKAFQAATREQANPQLAAMERVLKGGGAIGPSGQPAGLAPSPLFAMKDANDEIIRGKKQIQAEEHLTAAGLQNYINTGVIGYRDLMAAAKRGHEEDMRNLREEDEARKGAIEREKTKKEAAVVAAKAEFARVGPQAVTAPPAGLWEQYTNSIKGSMDQVKTSIDTGIEKVVAGVKELATPTNETSSGISRLIDLLAGAG